MSRFNDAANKIRENEGMLLVVYVVFIAMFVVGCFTSYEDYMTSKKGYEMLPTRKATNGVSDMVAMIPQLGQIGFVYLLGRDKEKRWMFWVVAGLLIVDVGTDVYFKASGSELYVWAIAFAESILIYTLGSEIFLTTSLAMIINLFPDVRKVIDKTVDGVIGGDDNEPTQGPPQMRNR